MLGTNPEKASNIMACRKMVNYFMAAVIPIYSLHFAKYSFPIEIQTRKSFERLLSGADYMRRAGLVCRDLGTSGKHTKNQLRDDMKKFQPG